ncbi:MAG: hypothetical protein ACD_63C00197G0001 [uncultured bacterium]|nr:MAG: hypothetical protein ACD_63C00197G0001 [uncultured bacterium]
MRKKLSVLILLIAVVALFSAGCNWKFWKSQDDTADITNNAVVNTTTPAGTATATPAPARDFSDYPIKVGNKWVYDVSSTFKNPYGEGEAGEYNLTAEIMDVSTNGLEWTDKVTDTLATGKAEAKMGYGLDAAKKNLYLNLSETTMDLEPYGIVGSGTITKEFKGLKIVSLDQNQWDISGNAKVTVRGGGVPAQSFDFNVSGEGKILDKKASFNTQAGEFTNLLRVQVQYTLSGGEVETTQVEVYWIDLGVGIIKYNLDQTQVKPISPLPAGGKSTMVLKEYEI